MRRDKLAPIHDWPRRLVVAIYAHPEGYPPTLNALSKLAEVYGQIDLLYRPHLDERFRYPAPVRLHASGERMSESRQMSIPLPQRYALFARFCQDLRKLIRDNRPELVLVYDPLALLAASLIWPLLKTRPKLWYHNHDVLEPTQLRPLSLAWLASFAQRYMWPRLDIFSLPAKERERYFDMGALRGRYFFLPNLPTLEQIDRPLRSPRDRSKLRLIFQGRVSEGHGIEEIIAALPLQVGGRQVELILAGWITTQFEARLRLLMAESGAERYVDLAGYRPYAQLHELTASCDVGIAVYRDTNIMNASVATASNKIYEYAASGLPILYLDTPHFRAHLSKLAWALPWDGTAQSLARSLEPIVERRDALSEAARQTCRESLHFERNFAAVIAFLEQVSPSPVP